MTEITSPLSSRYALAGVRSATTGPQQAFIRRAVQVLGRDDRVMAAYLVGGFAIGRADPWSDVDLQVIVADEAADDIAASWTAIVEALSPTASVRPFGFATGGICITPEWLHFDIVFHPRSKVDPHQVEGMAPLLDKSGILPQGPLPRPDRRTEPFFPEAAVDMFLYMLGNMVSVVGRNEPIPATNGVIMVRDIALVGLLLAEQGWAATREHSFGNPFPFTKR